MSPEIFDRESHGEVEIGTLKLVGYFNFQIGSRGFLNLQGAQLGAQLKVQLSRFLYL